MHISRKMVCALCFGILMTAMWSCSFISVDTDYDPAVDFSSYRTFKWIPRADRTRQDTAEISPLFSKRLRYTVDRVLTAKGYRQASSGPADFLITFHVGLKDKVEVTDYGYGYGGFRGSSARYNNYWGSSYYSQDIDVYQFTEMRLVLDFVDSKSNELIWRGLATGVISGIGSDEKRIHDAVEKMLGKFPPGA